MKRREERKTRKKLVKKNKVRGVSKPGLAKGKEGGLDDSVNEGLTNENGLGSKLKKVAGI
jgi:hypothetical protein